MIWASGRGLLEVYAASGVDREVRVDSSLSWGSGRGLLEVYLEEVY